MRIQRSLRLRVPVVRERPQEITPVAGIVIRDPLPRCCKEMSLRGRFA